MEQVIRDFENLDRNYQKLIEKYAGRMEELKKEAGGSISDIPADPRHEYHVLQQMLSAAHSLRKDGLLKNAIVDVVIEEVVPVVENKLEEPKKVEWSLDSAKDSTKEKEEEKK